MDGLTEGQKIHRLIRHRLLQEPLSDVLLARVESARGGSFEPRDVNKSLLEVNEYFAAKDYEPLIRLLNVYPSDSRSKSPVYFIHKDTGEKLSWLEMVRRNHKRRYSYDNFGADWRAHIEELRNDYRMESSVFDLDADSGYNGIKWRDLLTIYTTQYGRLMNGYFTIIDKEGEQVPFVMNPHQQTIYRHWTAKHSRLVLLKSRQIGGSYLALLRSFDDVLTIPDRLSGLMAHGKREASLLTERVKKAWGWLDPRIKELLAVELTRENSEEFGFSNGSKIQISVSFRSATLHSLHVSEYGKISAKDPIKARETFSGTLQAIRGGLPVLIESTGEGVNNDFYDLWTRSVEYLKSGKPLGPKDFYPVFISAFDDPDCRLDLDEYGYTPEEIDAEIENNRKLREFFATIAAEFENELGRKVNATGVVTYEQKAWFLQQYREFGGDMSLLLQEYPLVPTQAFQAGKQGEYFAEVIRENILARNRLSAEYERNLDTYASFDLGMADQMVGVVFQVHRNELRVIDFIEGSGEPISYYCQKLMALPYSITRIYLPADGAVRDLSTGMARWKEFQRWGYQVRVLEKSRSLIEDIELTRQVLAKYAWFGPRSRELLNWLMKYRKEYDERLEVFKDRPRHDQASHYADAMRYCCIAATRYLKLGNGGIRKGRDSTLARLNSAQVIDGLAI